MRQSSLDKIVDLGIYFVIGLTLTLRVAVSSGISMGGSSIFCSDFAAFYVAGKLAMEGRVSAAYQSQFDDLETFCGMSKTPWAYPPPYTLLTEVFAPFGYNISFFLFEALTLGAFLYALRKLSISLRDYNLARLACMPALLANLVMGQNGFLTGALIGFFAIAYLQRNGRAGVALGLLIIKPHLATGIGFLPLVQRRKDVITAMAATACALILMSTLAFGVEVWSHFLHGANEASKLLWQGNYRISSMTSIYASAYTLLATPAIAMLLQLICAVYCLSLIYANRNNGAQRNILGLAVLATLGVSPYIYGYDWTVYGMSVALLLPCLSAFATLAEKAALAFFSLLASGFSFLNPLLNSQTPAGSGTKMLAPGGACFLAIMAIMMVVIRRRERSISAENA